MKKLINAVCLMSLFLCLSHTACTADEKPKRVGKIPVSDAPVTISGKLWNLVWAEEFNYTGKPNPKYWDYEIAAPYKNSEQQYYTDRLKNVRVEDGKLILEAHLEKMTDYKGSTKMGTAKYTSGAINTRNRVHFLYGRMEASCRFSIAKGSWPAFWAMGHKYKWNKCGEIDVMEYMRRPNQVKASMHPGGGRWVEVMDPDKELHTYTVVWSPEEMQFYVDGKRFWGRGLEQFQGYRGNDKMFRMPFYLLLNIAIGGIGGGPEIDESAFPMRMEVDYVRVYHRIGAAYKQEVSICDKPLRHWKVHPGDWPLKEPGSETEAISGLAAEDIVLEDFDGGSFGKWQVTGIAFGSRPVDYAKEGNQSHWKPYFSNGRRGGFVASWQEVKTRNQGAGELLSAEYKIERRYLWLPIDNKAAESRLTITIDGKPVQACDIGIAPGKPDWWTFFDLEDYIGKQAKLELGRLQVCDGGMKLIKTDDSIPYADKLYQEAGRPQFHFSQIQGWNNDVNGPIYYKGEWHLCWQSNPVGMRHRNMYWGHAKSTKRRFHRRER